MKPVYVVLLMGAAAVGGALAVRYSERPMKIAVAGSLPPTVVAPPIPPVVRVGPSNAVPVHSDPVAPGSAAPDPPLPKPQKPSALSQLVHIGKSDAPVAPQPLARTRIPVEPPAVTVLESPAASRPAPPPAPVAAKEAPAAPRADLQPPPPGPNHATLKAGMLIMVRINQALSSNVSSPGDVFSGTLDRPLIADGFVIAERGAEVRGEVVASKSGGNGQGLPELTIRLREILASDGQRVHLVSQLWRKQGTGYAGNDAFSRNVYDIALTRGGAAVIRPATTIPFRLDQSVELTEKQ